MRAGPRFDDILEEKMAEWPALATASELFAAGAEPSTRRPDPMLLFGAQVLLGQDHSARPAACRAYSSFPPAHLTGPRPARVSRVLSTVQRQALECLRGFGEVTLDEAFSDSEVRAAFRSLARRFHPDRHPDASDDDRRYLARSFDRIATAYHQLTTGAAVS